MDFKDFDKLCAFRRLNITDEWYDFQNRGIYLYGEDHNQILRSYETLDIILRVPSKITYDMSVQLRDIIDNEIILKIIEAVRGYNK
jgi:hypothetical protein